jgi:hypothetical protein
MGDLAEALSDIDCDNIFIAADLVLSTTDESLTIDVNKTVTVSKNVTLTVPEDYTLVLNSGSRLTVGGTLGVSANALVAVAGSNTYLNCEDIERTGAAELVINGGTINNAGTLRLWPASTETAEDYDGGTGGIIAGKSGGGAILSAGNIEINGGLRTRRPAHTTMPAELK